MYSKTRDKNNRDRKLVKDKWRASESSGILLMEKTREKSELWLTKFGSKSWQLSRVYFASRRVSYWGGYIIERGPRLLYLVQIIERANGCHRTRNNKQLIFQRPNSDTITILPYALKNWPHSWWKKPLKSHRRALISGCGISRSAVSMLMRYGLS